MRYFLNGLLSVVVVGDSDAVQGERRLAADTFKSSKRIKADLFLLPLAPPTDLVKCTLSYRTEECFQLN